MIALSFGFVLFLASQALFVFNGPLDALNPLAFQYPLKLSLITASLDPVSTKLRSAAMNPFDSNFSASVLPTHTTAPEDSDVLIVPGVYPGILDGRNATTNKSLAWISHARRVVDRNVWTSSVYGADVALAIATRNGMEYERHENSTWDPFADLYNL
ncbi:hypothetical protein C8J56DRAFT_1004820 [Mycena floridula]|nr:hypothetical protein C8J56DRAFT_1004820 [Mycena floridula]